MRPPSDMTPGPRDPGELAEPTADRTQTVAHGPAYLVGRPIGEILKAIAGLTEDKLQEALAAQAEKGGRLGELLVGVKSVTEEQVARALGLQLDLPYLA